MPELKIALTAELSPIQSGKNGVSWRKRDVETVLYSGGLKPVWSLTQCSFCDAPRGVAWPTSVSVHKGPILDGSR